MTRKRMALLLAALLALASCGEQTQPEGVRLWFPTDMDSPRHSAQAVTWETAASSGTVGPEFLVSALLAGPKEDGLADFFPEGTQLLGWELDAGTLSLNFSEPLAALSGVDLTLAGYCLTLTLCQLEQVERVCLLAEGKPVSDQVFNAEDVIFTGAEEEPRQISVALYFPRTLGKGLGFETRELTLTEGDNLLEMIADALMQGPTDPDLQTFLPGKETLLGVWTDDSVCFVNFSAEFLAQVPEETAQRNLLLYSVVDTFGNLESVTAVQVLVEGERLPEFGGAETNLPLEPDFGMLRGG